MKEQALAERVAELLAEIGRLSEQVRDQQTQLEYLEKGRVRYTERG